MSFLAPTWTTIHSGLVDIALRIKAKNEDFEAIVGIARGGWIPARVLSDLLGIKRLISIQVESYKDLKKTSLRNLDAVHLLNERKILLVDDVADTGSSLVYTKKLLEEKGTKCVTVAIYVKPWTTFWPDYYYKEVREWVVFPWELFETIGIRLNQGTNNPREALAEMGVDSQLSALIGPLLSGLHENKNRSKKL
jgi:hypoxanthine phosphoribosyltransferase